ncbi:hypothetical protein [Leptolyngbya sp. 7M]|uniref:hypothetical protein n=1 Tax=Leptolyngbya sp. 7M TaxID=2812896 RepID=UPI001B8C6DDF|nr:hypothetical protein [Leptolyngbya sp. 7M]QYO68101.1 hypothetical protein JVX88_15810 [Leptolyngbya sp. 7M]
MLSNDDNITTTSEIRTGQKKIDVATENGSAVIRLSIYEKDLGWCTQKTITVDPEMLEVLIEKLSVAGLDLTEDNILSAEIIEY